MIPFEPEYRECDAHDCAEELWFGDVVFLAPGPEYYCSLECALSMEWEPEHLEEVEFCDIWGRGWSVF